MTIVALFIVTVLGIMAFPMLIPYLLLSFMAVDGIASREFINGLHATVRGVNIYFPDLLYSAVTFLAIFGLLRLVVAGRLRKYAPLTKTVMFLVVCYFMFFAAKMANGYFDGVPAQTLVRHFAIDSSCIYFFLPLFYVKNEESLKRLLFFVVFVSFVFPLVQPLLYGSADQMALERGQGGTLRLGAGNGNVLLMLGALALFVWDQKIWLSALPMAGIAMLAQRSAFVALAVCIMVLSFQKKKSIKFISLSVIAGGLLVGALVVIQATTSVPVVDKAADRLSQTFEKTGTTEARIQMIPLSLNAFMERPFVGFSYFDRYALEQKQSLDAFSFDMVHPHNMVLSSLLYAGSIGTVLLFGIVGLTMLAPLRLMRQQTTKQQGMYLFSTTLFFIIFSLMNTTFESVGQVFWILAGVSMWYLNRAYFQKRTTTAGANMKLTEYRGGSLDVGPADKAIQPARP